MIAEAVNNKVNKLLSNKLTNPTGGEQKKDVPASKKDANIGLRIPGSNWQMFKTLVTETSNETNPSDIQVKRKKRNRKRTQSSKEPAPKQQIQVQQQAAKTETKENEKKEESNTGLTKVVAMDCEMVGIGDGTDSMVARVSIVNRHGYCVYDKYVKPTEKVKDYRTAVSGIQPHHLETGQDFKVVQKEVAEILRGRTLVGHALHNDLAVLFLSHPKRFQRDTSRYKVFRKVTKGNTPSLKKLASELLGLDIQSAEHDSIEDARATMQLYQLFRKKWENDIRTKR
ncbi:RNA exonuclease 4 [Nasonia vitripennis]|uniref:RNA exonuclease 4 n=1 Tax=Nasonia vitripennis TaxID=7425 RepID=A0A7M7G9K4_NASVI|nr:RNA exonuclease 4 [Nasonia vitripennis]